MDIKESRWFKVINGETGLLAIVISLIFVVALVFIYIKRVREEPRKIFSFFTDDHRSVPTKILRVTVFIILTFGFLAVIYYNIKKMATDDPLLSVKVEENTLSPSFLFCVNDPVRVEVLLAKYTNIKQNNVADLLDSFNDFTLGGVRRDDAKLNCQLFNETLSQKPEGEIGGFYQFNINSNGSGIILYIGNFNDIDKSLTIPQGGIHSSIGTQVVTAKSSIFTYSESRYKDLDGGKIHRSFELSPIGSGTTQGAQDDGTLSLMIFAPPSVIMNSEEPPLDLAMFFGNFGGYLTICGIFGFLFGSGKMSPFGFVTDYCFTTKDKDSLMKNLNKDGNGSEKFNAEAEFERQLTEYYVDMELFSPN